MQFMTVKVTSICDGKVCYEPVESIELPFESQVPRAVPFPRTQPAKTTWYGEIMRLIYETEMGKGRPRSPKIPPLPGGRR